MYVDGAETEQTAWSLVLLVLCDCDWPALTAFARDCGRMEQGAGDEPTAQQQGELAGGGGGVDKALLQQCAGMIKELNDNLTQVCICVFCACKLGRMIAVVSLMEAVCEGLCFSCVLWMLTSLAPMSLTQVYDIYAELAPVPKEE